MWIWKSRWISGRATDCTVWGGGADVVAASLLAELTVGLLALAAEVAVCFVFAFGFGSLSLVSSGSFF